MTVTSLSSTTTGAAPPPHPHGGPPRTPPPMTGTAQLLGVSADELEQARRSGTTLSDLAAQKASRTRPSSRASPPTSRRTSPRARPSSPPPS
jgi:hypothetical protein